MAKIDSIKDKATARHVHDVIKQHLETAAQELGMTLATTKGSYDLSMFQVKAVFQSQSKEALERREGIANFQASLLGLPADIIGKVVSLQGRQMKIVGIRARATKKPIEIEEVSTGERFITTKETIQRALRAG